MLHVSGAVKQISFVIAIGFVATVWPTSTPSLWVTPTTVFLFWEMFWIFGELHVFLLWQRRCVGRQRWKVSEHAHISELNFHRFNLFTANYILYIFENAIGRFGISAHAVDTRFSTAHSNWFWFWVGRQKIQYCIEDLQFIRFHFSSSHVYEITTFKISFSDWNLNSQIRNSTKNRSIVVIFATQYARQSQK